MAALNSEAEEEDLYMISQVAALNSEKEDLYMISQGIYITVSEKIGNENEVMLRRQTIDIMNVFHNNEACCQYQYIRSGSRAEGFMFVSSDVDNMLVNRNIIVLNSAYYNSFNTANFPTVLLMETKGIQPGYTLLKCLKFDIRDEILCSALELRAGEVYFRNSIKKEFFIFESTPIHGPCARGQTSYGEEFDFAYTLKCPFWPEQARPFINRSLHQGWPSIDVLLEIIEDGSLLVPINSRQNMSSSTAVLEWRISFSMAEKKLIYSMNHSQFLCYGLMKIFLNEILKKISDIENLLCSYYMKTAVFWEISDNKNGWTSLNFMVKFWNVFRRIIKWVSTGYCPNFFIPENNMFKTKIYGAAQRSLMRRLCSLHEEGYQCLLHCESLNKELSLYIEYPFQMIFTEDYRFELQIVLFLCGTMKSVYKANDVKDLMKTLFKTAALVPTPELIVWPLHLRINYILQEIATTLYSTPNVPNIVNKSNKLRYEYICAAQTLSKAKTSLCMNKIYLASCTYVNGQYRKTIQIVQSIKQRLQRQPYMYIWNLNEDLIKRSTEQGMSYEKIVRSFVLEQFMYISKISIDELKLENIAGAHYSDIYELKIPPLVYLNLLLILSHIRLNELQGRDDVLSELQSLVWHDDGCHIYPGDKTISWEILGICQHLCGHYHDAYQSYVYALNGIYNYYKQATIIRIMLIIFHLMNI